MLADIFAVVLGRTLCFAMKEFSKARASPSTPASSLITVTAL
jgi:hypothetical protein